MSLTLWYHIKWSGIVENSAGKQKEKSHVQLFYQTLIVVLIKSEGQNYLYEVWTKIRQISIFLYTALSVIYLIIVLLNSLNSKNVKYEIRAKKARKTEQNQKKLDEDAMLCNTLWSDRRRLVTKNISCLFAYF